MKTLILILLDESGSMGCQKDKVVSGFDQFIEEQKKVTNDEAVVTFLKFDNSVSIVFDYVPLANVPKLIGYSPGGGTALYDAILDGVNLVEPRENEVDRVICLIITDGEDYDSRKANASGTGHLIQKKESERKWTFLYIGQNPERWAEKTGMSANNAAKYDFADQGNNFATSTAGVSKIRNQNALQVMNALHDLFDNAMASTPSNGSGSSSSVPATSSSVHSNITPTSKLPRSLQRKCNQMPNSVRRSSRHLPGRKQLTSVPAVRTRANGLLRRLVKA
jgi:uncharacterized protein YegL